MARWRIMMLIVGSAAVLCAVIGRANAQGDAANAPVASETTEKTVEKVPEKVDVTPVAADTDISQRLEDIYRATGWFSDVDVSVRDGVVFLKGRTNQDRYRDWAEALAQKTESVVAVVNQIQLTLPDAWDFSPAGAEFRRLGRSIVKSLPMAIVAVLVLVLSVIAARLMRSSMRRLLAGRLKSQLLREVTARTLGVLVFLIGLYLVLRISGLSRLAATVIGGTGLIGLVLGIAFRDITENFLASLFLSMQNPFREGDLVDIGGTQGYVERLTSRTTVLTTLDGIQVQIPNATVFKSTIQNLTGNPSRRDSFTIGIGYDDPIQEAQEVALRVLTEHPAVLADPEPWVLVDGLGASTVNLKVYYWLDINEHSQIKTRSSVIRLVKNALSAAGISIPDEAREIVFPKGVPVRMLEAAGTTSPKPERTARPVPRSVDKEVASAGEKNLKSEASEIKREARKGWSPDQGENLLADGDESGDGAKVADGDATD